MSPTEAALLGLVQGLTEFLPISSSGHLVLGKALLRVDSEGAGVLFEVLVHAGTLVAILVVFWRDFQELLRGSLGMLRHLTGGPREWLAHDERRLAFLVALGTLPVVLAVLVAKKQIERAIDDPEVGPLLTGCCLLVTGALLWRTHWHRGTEEQITPQIALLVGLGQAVALLPGISRSGTTIAVALFLGLDRVTAARFSFLLAIPAILGATILQSIKLVKKPPPLETLGAYSLGMLVAFLSGLFALVLLLRIVRVGKLAWFAPYCFAAGSVAIFLSLRS